VTVTPAFDNIIDLTAYLLSVSGGYTSADPVPLTVSLDLASDWGNLLSAIQTEGKFVALDLSACTMPGTEFDPGAADTGEDKIVSLVLPGAAKEIKDSYSYPGPTFRFFTKLETVTGANIQSVGQNAFQSCTTLIEVNLPEAASIGYRAFKSCTALVDLNLPAATSIGPNAFDSCTALVDLNLPAATSIGYNAFDSCTALITVTLPEATFIDYGAFTDCTALTTVSLPEAISIGGYAFNTCNALTTVSLPKAESIGDWAFAFCITLTELSLPAAESIGILAFRACSALTTVTLPAATSIGATAFQQCNALTTVSLPVVASIGYSAFANTGDTALTVSLGNTAPGLGTRLFNGVTAAKNVTVKVPPGAAGYGTVPGTYSGTDSTACWGNGFRFGGWNDGVMLSGAMNSYINLTITYTP
jgi:hypothetical protein